MLSSSKKINILSMISKTPHPVLLLMSGAKTSGNPTGFSIHSKFIWAEARSWPNSIFDTCWAFGH